MNKKILIILVIGLFLLGSLIFFKIETSKIVSCDSVVCYVQVEPQYQVQYPHENPETILESYKPENSILCFKNKKRPPMGEISVVRHWDYQYVCLTTRSFSK